MYILGKKVPDPKKVYRGLMKIKGINVTTAKYICQQNSLSPNLLVKHLTKTQENEIQAFIEKQQYKLEEEISQKRTDSIIKYIENGSVRGFRHRHGLPVRGQRTHSNAKSQKKRKFNYIKK